jgi:hypothetical protein
MEVDFIISNPYVSLFGFKDYDELYRVKKDLENLWLSKGKEVIEFIEEETGVKFKNSTYDCYLVGKFPYKGISKPITIRVSKKVSGNFVTLIHELIHNLLVENKGHFKGMFEELGIEEDGRVESHIVIFDLLKKICEKFIDKDLFLEIRIVNEQYFKKSFEFLDKFSDGIEYK